jgi:hypothetical protein
MNNIQKRFLLFIFGCIAIRLLFTYIAKNSSPEFLPALGFIALIPVIGWAYIMFIGKRDTGGEVFGEQIWWKDLRIIHTAFYASFAYLAINKNSNAWIFLASDTMFGLLAFLLHHSNVGSFDKLISL